jgi:PhnB protein
MLTDEIAEYGLRGPKSLGGSPVHLSIYVDDADAVANEAVAAGAKLVIPVADQFYGARSGRIEDPFGHIWIIQTQKENWSALPHPEKEQRLAKFMKSMNP